LGLLLPIIETSLQDRQILAEDLSLFKESDVLKILTIVDDLRHAVEINSFIDRASQQSDMEAFSQLLKTVVHRIKAMKPGDVVVLPGGWATPSGGHAIIYIVELCRPNDYAFCVCNTGNGNAYHPSVGTDYPKTKFRTAMRFSGIPLERMASVEFWYMTFNIMITRSLHHKPEVVYEVLLPFLADGPFHLKVEKELDLCGHWESPQRSGTCYYRCILTALRYLMKRRGFSKLQQKQLFVQIRSGYLSVVERDLWNELFTQGLNSSDAYMIELACNQTGNAGVKLFNAKEEKLNPKSLGKLDAQFHRIKSRLAELHDISARNADSEAVVSTVKSIAEMKPFEGFDLIMDDSDRSLKRGSTAVGANSLYINLLIPFARPASVHDLCLLFDWAADRCDEIRTKSNLAAASVGLNQISSFMEYIFLTFVDFPDPVEAVSGEIAIGGSVETPEANKQILSIIKSSVQAESATWKNWSQMTKEVQRSALLNVQRLAIHYVAAAKSLGTEDRVSSAVKSLTTSAIFVVFDALSRIILPKRPLELSQILSEYGCVVSCALNGNRPISKMMDRYLLTRPECCIARYYVVRYLEAVSKFSSKLLFDYKFEEGNDMAIKLEESSATMACVKDLQVATGCFGGEIPIANDRRGRTIQSRVAKLNELETLYAWFSSTWSDVAPEFARYRDLNLLFRLMLQPQQMFSSGRAPQLEIWLTHDAQPELDFISTSADRKAVLFTVLLAGTTISPSCKFSSRSPLYDQLEAITNSTEELTEEAILFNDALPDFDHTLSSQETEHFFTLLLYPYISGPLILHFFSGDRIALLVNNKIQSIVEALLFEPRTLSYIEDHEAVNEVRVVPARSRGQLQSKFGIMYDEMKYSPQTLLSPLMSLIEGAIAISISGFRSSVVGLVLFLVRICVRIEILCMHCIKHMLKDPTLGASLPSEVFQLHSLLATKVSKQLEEWIASSLQEREIEFAVRFHAHLALIFATSLDIASFDQGSDWLSNAEFYPAIRKYLCSSTYVTCWHGNKSGQSSGAEDDDSRKGNFYRKRRATEKKKSTVDANMAPAEDSPVSTVFATVQRLRPAICNWLQIVSSNQLDSILDSVASVGLQHPFKETSGWNRVSNVPLVCSLTVGNEVHPYLPCTDWSQTVSFPGATSINIFFDPRSATEKTSDYVTISYPGCMLRFDGPAGSMWPGSNGSPSLSIPYDTFVVEFHSDRSGGDWGFSFTAVAPICLSAAQRLVDRSQCSMLVAQLALRECRNYEELALQFIAERENELKVMESEEIRKRTDADGSNDVSPGLYQDCYGYVQINLQTCEVYVNNRMNMPIPSEIAAHADYVAHFGKFKNILCTISSKDTNRQCIQIIDPDGRFGAYEIQAWTPLKPYGRKGTGLGAILSDEADAVADDGRSTAFNLPMTVQDVITYQGQKYVRYIQGQCGWLSALFDKLQFLTDDDLIGVWCSESCFKMSQSSAREQDGDDASIVGRMFVQMQCSPGGRDLSDIEGHPGAWFEVKAIQSERLLLVFALVEVGRRMQRTLVYASDLRLALKTLEPNTEFMESPRHYLLQSEGGHILDTFKDRSGRVIARPGVGANQHATVFSLVVRRSRLEISSQVESMRNELGIFCATNGPIDDVSQEEHILEEYVNPGSLQGLVPEYFLEEFQFWRTGDRLIRGYKYSLNASKTVNPFDEESILVVLEKRTATATVHKLMNGKRVLTLLNPLVNRSVTLNATIRALLNIFTRVETLSHVLFWTKSNGNSSSASPAEISRIELPRLKTAFDIKVRTPSEVDFALSDHDDLSLCFDVPASVKSLYADFANCIPVKNSTNQYFLLVPSFGLIQPSIKACPFMTSIVYDRSSNWYSKVQSRYFLYPVHPSSKYLEMPTISAAVYWTLLCFVYRKYTQVATLVNTVCQSDLKLNAEQRYILSQVPKTSSDSFKNVDSHPDAHACRLLLALMCAECGEKIETPEWKAAFWDIAEDFKDYQNKYGHVSQVCRLNLAEEESILAMFPDATRRNYLNALETVLATGTDKSIPSSGRSAQFGEDPVVKLATVIKRDLENWKKTLAGDAPAPATRMFWGGGGGRGDLYYRRPKGKDLVGSSAIVSLSSLWKCFEHQRSIAGSLSYLGFAFLYELLSGQVVLQLTDDPVPEPPVTTPNVAKVSAKPAAPAKAKTPKYVDDYSSMAMQIQAMDMCTDWSLEEVCALIDIHDGNMEPAIINFMEEPEAAKLSVLKKVTATSFGVGSKVECNYKGYGQWYPGLIVNDHGNDRYDIAFDDGDFEEGAFKPLIRVVSDLDSEPALKMLKETGIINDMNPGEVQAFVRINKDRDLNQVVADYVADPDVAKAEVKKYLEDEAAKEEMLRIERATPRQYPRNWLLVKLMAHMMMIVDKGGNTKLLSLLLLGTKFIENVRPGVMPCLPLFPYTANMKDLDSQQGLTAKNCAHFYVSTIDKSLQLLNDTMRGNKDIDKPVAIPSQIAVRFDEYRVRPNISNTRCSRRPVCLLKLPATVSGGLSMRETDALNAFSVSAEELHALSSTPLSSLHCFQQIENVAAASDHLSDLPFDISSHPAAQNNPPADAMIERIKEDLKHSAAVLAARTRPRIRFLKELTAANFSGVAVLEELNKMQEEFLWCMNSDNQKVIDGIQVIEKLLNVFDSNDGSVDKLKFKFLLNSGKRCRISFEMFAASLASDTQVSDLQHINPFLTSELCEIVNSVTVVLLMRFVRSRQIAACIDKVRKLSHGVMKALSSTVDMVNSQHMLVHQSSELAEEMVKVRHCVFLDPANTGVTYVDPRYLLFEFITGFLLRQRQVELIQDFLHSHSEGKSSVHQMIMGQGKTQVRNYSKLIVRFMG
jgi:hypothetical protein